ncbi:hypothetical protein HYY72_01310 [Candidatus Woesearchaeota archaeon]|nr:hypothetical protein [Candidatus Woesearchaeota archaeon]
MAIAIEKELAESGYKMIGLQESKEELLSAILNSGNIRYLKAIPFLLYNYPINLDLLYLRTDKKKLLGQVISITRKIFEEERIDKQLPNIYEESNLDYNDFKQEFQMQKSSLDKPQLMTEKQKIYGERDLQMWLSKIFTKKERWIMRRILEEKSVSRTDYEYYSRKTKKKLDSILNLQDIARTLYHKSPNVDEDLFKLKKMLEEKYGPIRSIYLQNRCLLLTLTTDEKHENSSPRIMAIELKTIKNPEILSLLQEYEGEKQEFT